LLCGIAATALFFYVAASLAIANARSFYYTGFCDTSETDCSLPWTTARVATWILWGAAGLVLAATTIVSFRSGARRISLAGLVTAAVLAVAAIALFRTL
jgi:hypothetical protein